MLISDKWIEHCRHRTLSLKQMQLFSPMSLMSNKERTCMNYASFMDLIHLSLLESAKSSLCHTDRLIN